MSIYCRDSKLGAEVRPVGVYQQAKSMLLTVIITRKSQANIKIDISTI